MSPSSSSRAQPHDAPSRGLQSSPSHSHARGSTDTSSAPLRLRVKFGGLHFVVPVQTRDVRVADLAQRIQHKCAKMFPASAPTAAKVFCMHFDVCVCVCVCVCVYMCVCVCVCDV